ncbi:unnamed protein product [Acanthoscelides obtectus]|uniref:Uncharacterized protein n=1 Tax=Acanthoscelides obtectus TaxID=200917 RepID=A0A9P0NS55_ACAOB|nr:unnamed protein product [Acanthoscelides obtectus]CAK1661587.1 hypothetical protein AOBTE_LOCUS22702 [Acanthoscelides obtectus]
MYFVTTRPWCNRTYVTLTLLHKYCKLTHLDLFFQKMVCYVNSTNAG